MTKRYILIQQYVLGNTQNSLLFLGGFVFDQKDTMRMLHKWIPVTECMCIAIPVSSPLFLAGSHFLSSTISQKAGYSINGENMFDISLDPPRLCIRTVAPPIWKPYCPVSLRLVGYTSILSYTVTVLS